MDNGIKEVELIVSGDVQGVGYRLFVKRIARKLNVKGYVLNLEDETVKIQCKGEEKNIIEFKKKINTKNPPEAPFIYVDDIIKETPLPQGTITQTTFKVIPGETNVEIMEGDNTGMNYLNFFREQTNANFARMDEKYDAISKGMFAIVNEIKETNKAFESRMEKNNKAFENKIETIENRLEKTDKSIESMLKFLVQKQN